MGKKRVRLLFQIARYYTLFTKQKLMKKTKAEIAALHNVHWNSAQQSETLDFALFSVEELEDFLKAIKGTASNVAVLVVRGDFGGKQNILSVAMIGTITSSLQEHANHGAIVASFDDNDGIVSDAPCPPYCGGKGGGTGGN